MSELFSAKTEQFSLRAETSPDRMKIFIDLEPVLGAKIRREDLLGWLGRHLKTDALDLGVLDDLIKQANLGHKTEKRRIVKGTEAVDGVDGKLVALVKKYTGRGEAKIDGKGFSRFAELKLFDNVRAGQTVARLYPPKPGIDGKDALGGVVRAKAGKLLRVMLDKTLELREGEGGKAAYQILVALIDGMWCEESGRLMISDVLEIKGDVDYRCGNIDFVGTVKVHGDVLPGFAVKARKGLEVRGAVRGAAVYCSEGEVIVRGFIYGGPNAKVVSAKGVFAAGLDQARVESAGDVVLAKEALGSSVFSQSALFLDKGTLAGGAVSVVRGLQAKNVGNEANLRTVVALCSDIEAGTEYTELAARMLSHERAAALIKLHLGPYAENQALIRGLAPAHCTKISRLLTKLRDIQRSEAELERRRRDLLGRAKRADRQLVNFRHRLYQGVEVAAQDSLYKPGHDLEGPATLEYVPESKEFKVSALSELARTAPPDAKPGEKK